jgi:hypothetical protein
VQYGTAQYQLNWRQSLPDAMAFQKGVSPSDVCRYEKRWSSSAEVDKGLLVGRIQGAALISFHQTTIDDSGAGE